MRNGGEVEGAAPIGWPASAGVLELLGTQLRKHVDGLKVDEESSFGIEQSPSGSLMVSISGTNAEGARPMGAIWRQREEVEGRNKIVERRSAMPLADEAQALAILRSYARANGNFETMIEWTIQ